MTESEQLVQAIAALEAQRALLGDAVVDTAVAPMREKLVSLQAQLTPSEQQRKQVTILFASVSDLANVSEGLDAEEMTAILKTLWARLDAIIAGHGGRTDLHISNDRMALWGSVQAREDDPERAVRAALAMQAELAAFRDERRQSWGLRIGLHTGLAWLGEVGLTHTFTALGDAVNLAARLQAAAPVGGILISHDVYRLVHGIFDMLPQPLLTVKGKAEPVQTYLVRRVLPLTFQNGARSIQGIQTRMVGRQAELEHLQKLYHAVLEQGELRMALIVAGAGVGKSRLLHEFCTWTATRPESMLILQGRAVQEMQNSPYALLRTVFSARFQIQDSDSIAVVQDKMERGVAWAMGQDQGGVAVPEARMRAHFIGHLLGFNLSASPFLHDILQDARQIRDRALLYLSDLFQTLRARASILILFLEDLHWADDSSLDAIQHLARQCAGQSLLIVSTARPELLERQPRWGEGNPVRTLIQLPLLARAQSQALVNDILCNLETIPDVLRETIVSYAEGNPFYIQELIKMLVEDGVIIAGETRWQVNPQRLAVMRVPSTLTAVLQARLDTLPPLDKAILQQASVVGRTFWAEAVDHLGRSTPAATAPALEALSRREIIFRQEHSTFDSTVEYAFRHALLRDVSYESVLLDERRTYHARAADWLIAVSGLRVSEFAGLIADHLERAGQAEPAADYLQQAGKRALSTSAFGEALRTLRRALALLPARHPRRAEILVEVGEGLEGLAEYQEARRYLEEGLSLASELEDHGTCAEALARLGIIALNQGDWARCRAYLEKGLPLAQQNNDETRTALVLWGLGWIDIREGLYRQARTHFAAGLAIYQTLNDKQGMAQTLMGLAGATGLEAAQASDKSAFQAVRDLYLQSLALCRQVGNRWAESSVLGNLGEMARLQGNYAEAIQYYEESSVLLDQVGSQMDLAIMLGNLGHALSAQGDYDAARRYYCRSLEIAVRVGALGTLLEGLVGLAGILAHTGEPTRAARIIGLAMNHPSLMDETRRDLVEPILAHLRAILPESQVARELERGRGLTPESVAAEFLTGVN